MDDFGKPPNYEGSNNCAPYQGASIKSKGECANHKHSSPLNIYC